jgi:hypothetical protein
MDFLRRKISGNRRRYVEGGYSLDLTYITSRIIAMSYPSHGLEAMGRNPIDAVSSITNSNFHI